MHVQELRTNLGKMPSVPLLQFEPNAMVQLCSVVYMPRSAAPECLALYLLLVTWLYRGLISPFLSPECTQWWCQSARASFSWMN